MVSIHGEFAHPSELGVRKTVALGPRVMKRFFLNTAAGNLILVFTRTNTMHTMFVLHDMFQHKRARANIKSHNVRLDERARARTRLPKAIGKFQEGTLFFKGAA